jgi:hypothetical protein
MGEQWTLDWCTFHFFGAVTLRLKSSFQLTVAHTTPDPIGGGAFKRFLLAVRYQIP